MAFDDLIGVIDGPVPLYMLSLVSCHCAVADVLFQVAMAVVARWTLFGPYVFDRLLMCS